jgi:two-component system response regulator FlrC
LLDEISEMDLALQAKLLRVLQERELERLGGGKVVELDVRVLATSNRDMRAEVAAGRFREDLFYRLNVFPLQLPPLRERPADILPLAHRSLARTASRSGEPTPSISEAAARKLQTYPWPGNIRELDNMMQRALILAAGSEAIGVEALHFEQVVPAATAVTAPPPATGLGDDLKRREYQRIMEALASGTRKAAAERLGISPRTLRYKIAQMREAGYPVN